MDLYGDDSPTRAPAPIVSQPSRRWLVAVVLIALSAAIVWQWGYLLRGPATDIIGWRTDPDTALAEARDSGKPLFIDFMAEWCGPCHMLDRKTFADPDVARAIREQFVPLRLDTDKAYAWPWAQRYRVFALPTLMIVSADGQPLARWEGFLTARQMRNWIDGGIQQHPTTPTGGGQDEADTGRFDRS